MSKYKIILLTIHPNLLAYKDFSGDTIYEMNVCLNSDGVFKLFEIAVLINFHDEYLKKSKKKLLDLIIPFLFMKKKTMTRCLL